MGGFLYNPNKGFASAPFVMLTPLWRYPTIIYLKAMCGEITVRSKRSLIVFVHLEGLGKL